MKIVPDNEDYQRVAIPLLVKALEEDEDFVRSEAAATLGSIGLAAQDARQKLEQLAAEDPSPNVREVAEQALQAIRE